MLEVARKNLAELGIANVDLLEGDVRALPLEEASVDAAFANMVLHHTEDPGAIIREMARVVKLGGVVAMVDEVDYPYGWMREEHADVWLGFEKGQVEGFFREAGLTDYGYTSPWGCSDASSPRPRTRSPTSASSPPGDVSQGNGFLPATAVPTGSLGDLEYVSKPSFGYLTQTSDQHRRANTPRFPQALSLPR